MSNGGMKFDGDKPNTQLLFGGMPLALLGVSAVLTFGAKKYAAHSWKTVPNNVERYKAAMIRHQLAIESGETHDQESGLPHAYHIACNALFLAELAAVGFQRDQRGERADRASPVQQPSGSADNRGRDGEHRSDEREVGGSAGRAEAQPEVAGGTVGDHGGRVRRDPVAASNLIQAIKDAQKCQHMYTWDGYFGNKAGYKCSLCGDSYLTNIPAITGGL